jgi:PilZ domain
MKTSVLRELRAVQRFEIELPVVLISRSGKDVRTSEALTRDISTRGMFVLSHSAFAEGEIVEFEIDLAWDEMTPLVLVKGDGRVVRIEKDSASQQSGFAVQNLWFKLHDAEAGEATAWQRLGSAFSQVPIPATQAKPRRLNIVPRKSDVSRKGLR